MLHKQIKMIVLFIAALFTGNFVSSANVEDLSTVEAYADLKRNADSESKRLQGYFDKQFNELREMIDTRITSVETDVNSKLANVEENVLRKVREDASNINGDEGQTLEETLKTEIDKQTAVMRKAISSEKRYLRDNIQTLDLRIKEVEENRRAAEEESLKRYTTDHDERKPVAHLIGSLHKQYSFPGQVLTPIIHWISTEGLAFTRNVNYRFGRLIIMEQGLYYVYSQLSFLEVFNSTNSMEAGNQSLSHEISRYNIVYHNGGFEPMIQNSITKCLGRNKSFGEYTSYLGAVFYLRQSDEVLVSVSDPALIVKESKFNSFGLFKVD